MLNPQKIHIFATYLFYAIIHNYRMRQSITNCTAGWQYLNFLALTLVTGSELLLAHILFFQNMLWKSESKTKTKKK